MALTTNAMGRPGAVCHALWPLAGLVVLGACTALGPPDIETSRAYGDVTRDALYDRTLQALQASDLKVTATDRAQGVITAVGRFDDRNWAECPDSLKLFDDQSSTQHMVEVQEDYRRVEVTASVAGASEGATLTLDPAFFAEPVSAMATTEECATTGVLERQILAAVGETA